MASAAAATVSVRWRTQTSPSGSVVWRTPPALYEALHREFEFTLDAAADDGNAQADRYFDLEVDALRMSWAGERVFCNPPYGRELEDWVAHGWRQASIDGALVVMVLPARTGNAWFHRYVLPHAEVRFIRGHRSRQRRALRRAHGANVRYLPAWKKWLLWDGKRWAVDETLGVIRLAKDTVRAMYAEARELEKADRSEAGQARHAVGEGGEAPRDARARPGRAGIAITPAQLDADPWLLSVENGTIDLRTAQLRDARARGSDHEARAGGVRPDAECPRWLAFLDRVLAGDGRAARVPAARGRLLAHRLTVGARALLPVRPRRQREVDLPRGAARAARRLREPGRLHDVPRAEGRRAAERHRAALRRARRHELRGRRREAAQRVAREDAHRRRDGHRAVPPRRVLRVQAGVQALARREPSAGHPRHRQRDLGPRAAHPVHGRDPRRGARRHLFAKLVAELPGILAWAVAGCVLWQREEGLGAPTPWRATDQYRRDSDTLGAFLEDCCELGPDTWWEGTTALYQAYAAWCTRSGEFQVKLQAFGNALAERGIAMKKVHGKKGRVGIRLRADLPLYAMHTRPDAAPAAAETPQDEQEALSI
jgi:putative DNA primase/helicase